MVSDLKKALFLEGVALDVVMKLKQRVAVDTGQLRSSINYNISGNTAEIRMWDYGKYVEFGTPPHIIRPKNAKALKFETNRKQRLSEGGKPNEVFAKQVNHPGTRPQPFIRPTFREDFVNIVAENAQRHLK